MDRNRSFVRNRAYSIAVFLLAAVLIAACFLDFNAQVRANLHRDSQAQTEAIGANAVRLLENEVGYLKKLTGTAAMLMGESDNQGAQDDEWIVAELERYAEHGSIVRTLFATLDGRVYTSYAGYLGQADENRSVIGIPITDIKEPIVVPPFYADDLHQVIFGVAAPASMGGRQGVLVSSYNVVQFESLFENKFSGGVEIGIVQRSGSVVLGHSHKERENAFGANIFEMYRMAGVQFATGSIEEMEANMAAGRAGYSSYAIEGEERYLSYLPTEIDDWYVAVMMPESAQRPQARAIQKNGVILTIKLTAVMAGLMSVVFVIRRREELSIRKILQDAAMLDGLTNIYNRGTAEQMLTEFFESADPSAHHGLFVMDIDAFKQTNDTYGHLMGDDVLVAFAEHLRHVFGGEAVLGRMGGDEFIALLVDCGGKQGALRRAAEVSSPFFRKEGIDAPDVSVSIGVALYPEDGSTFHTLYQKADKALYATKRQGKNGFTLYSAEEI